MRFKILQSTVERLLYIILFLIFSIFTIFLILTLKQDQELKAIGQQINSSQKLIIQNQVNGNKSVKVYINCLTHINPSGDVQVQLNQCFNAGPTVKK